MTLLFTKKEWDAAMPGLTKSMTAHLCQYRTGIFKHLVDKGGEWAEGWGSGSYLQVGDIVHVLTNEHVSTVIHKGQKVVYQFDGQDDICLFAGIDAELPAPFDLALLQVDMSAWHSVTHASKQVTFDQIALAHAPVE